MRRLSKTVGTALIMFFVFQTAAQAETFDLSDGLDPFFGGISDGINSVGLSYDATGQDNPGRGAFFGLSEDFTATGVSFIVEDSSAFTLYYELKQVSTRDRSGVANGTSLRSGSLSFGANDQTSLSPVSFSFSDVALSDSATYHLNFYSDSSNEGIRIPVFADTSGHMVGPFEAIDGSVRNGDVTNDVLTGIGITGFVTSIPEPSTWIMMLLGFALTAQALKRRQTAFRSHSKLLD